jgi:hypothetical protein
MSDPTDRCINLTTTLPRSDCWPYILVLFACFKPFRHADLTTTRAAFVSLWVGGYGVPKHDPASVRKFTTYEKGGTT